MILNVSMFFNMLLKIDWFKEIRKCIGIIVFSYVNVDVVVIWDK